jgi:hypothetical protein
MALSLIRKSSGGWISQWRSRRRTLNHRLCLAPAYVIERACPPVSSGDRGGRGGRLRDSSDLSRVSRQPVIYSGPTNANVCRLVPSVPNGPDWKNARPAIEGFPRGFARSVPTRRVQNQPARRCSALSGNARSSAFTASSSISQVRTKKSPVDKLMQGRKRKMGRPLHMSRSAQKRNKQSRALVLDPSESYG